MMTLTEHILRGAGCPTAGHCTVALSGGADSTALLIALYQLRERLSLTLSAVHVHHGIRGAEADRDAEFCAGLCARYGIPFTLVHVDAPAFAKQNRLSLETAARQLRYDALMQAAKSGEIATAHHADDNAETVLFHLLRGSGLRGLTGIPARSGRIIRPLLTATKAEILGFLGEIGQSYVEDSTNLTGENTRGRLRQTLMPALTAENPAAVRHLAQTAAALSEDEAYLTAIADRAYEAAQTDFGGLNGLSEIARPIRMRMYLRRLAALEARTDPSRVILEGIDALVQQGGGRFMPTGRIAAQVLRGTLYVNSVRAPMQGEFPLTDTPQEVVPGCTVFAEDAQLSRNIHTADTRVTLDTDKITGTLYFRQWAREDTLMLPGRNFHSRLHTLIGANIPAAERRRLHVLYDDCGAVFCEGIGIAARVRPDADSSRLTVIRITRPEG